MALERVKRTRRGDFLVRLTVAEREALRPMPGVLRQLLTDGDPKSDPALRRLFPAAYTDDAERSAEFAEMVSEDLKHQWISAIDTMEGTIDASRLSEEQVLGWLAAINDLRLVLGVRLDLTEESVSEDFRGDPERERSYAIYLLLSLLEEDIVDALSGNNVM